VRHGARIEREAIVKDEAGAPAVRNLAARGSETGPEPGKAGAKGAHVADLIREMIIQDELPPGAPIRERLLAQRLEVSRTPLREALRILSAEGLVELHPNRGAVVAAPSDQEVTDVLRLLGVLEAYAGEVACECATEDELREMWALHFEMLAAYQRGDRLAYFHRNQDIHLALVRASRNSALITQHGLLNARVYRVRYVANFRTRRWESAIKEHEAVLQALERHDAAEVARILRTHVTQAWEKLQALTHEEVAAPPTAPPET
jgi:DNA-binding GntR family transcriptional regulator